MTAPVVFQADPQALAELRASWQNHEDSPAVNKLLKKARSVLHEGPYTIVDKKHPLPGVDVHEYVSVAPYDWPNPDTNDGLPYIRKDACAIRIIRIMTSRH